MRQKAVVLGVAADPEPGNLVAFEKTHGSIRPGHTDGVDWFTGMNLFELEAGVPGVQAEESVGLLGRPANLGR